MADEDISVDQLLQDALDAAYQRGRQAGKLEERNKIDEALRRVVRQAVAETNILDQDINDLGLEERARNCLKRRRVDTVRDLILMTDDDVLAIVNLGQRSLENIKSVLAAHGLELRSRHCY